MVVSHNDGIAKYQQQSVLVYEIITTTYTSRIVCIINIVYNMINTIELWEQRLNKDAVKKY